LSVVEKLETGERAQNRRIWLIVGFSFVPVRVPESFRELVEERRYLLPKVPFLKRVVGLSSDRIYRQGEQVLMNGRAIATALKRDGTGRKLPDWQGC